MARPYVIRQGDFLLKLANQFGFDADAVWNDKQNEGLRQLGRDPHVLFPSDVLYVPSQEANPVPLNTGAQNDFVAHAPTVNIGIRFSDLAFASKACTVQELPELTGLTTGPDGLLKLDVPATVEAITITFSDPPCTCVCNIGYINPITTLSGVHQRLQNLGYIDDGAFDPADLELIRGALRAFKADQRPESNSSDPPLPDDPSQATSLPTHPEPSQTSTAPDPSPADAGQYPYDDTEGFDDGGTLEDAISKILSAAHSC
jgi:hypothetical protein